MQVSVASLWAAQSPKRALVPSQTACLSAACQHSSTPTLSKQRRAFTTEAVLCLRFWPLPLPCWSLEAYYTGQQVPSSENQGLQKCSENI